MKLKANLRQYIKQILKIESCKLFKQNSRIKNKKFTFMCSIYASTIILIPIFYFGDFQYYLTIFLNYNIAFKIFKKNNNN